MKTLSIKLTAELDARLRSFLRERNISKSDFVREAIDAYLNQQHNENARGSVADLIQDLLGSVRGPKDLATNKKYLKGYGE
jgi:metal-responsive CopG/Arc/MetJ family transcriptional regulator